MTSLIDRMIDKACGIKPGDLKPGQWITLRCPGCKMEKRAKKDITDPPGTVIVVVQCSECNGGDFDSPTYIDDDGNDLPFVEID